MFKGEALAIEAFETRVLVGRHPDDPGRLKSAPMPEEIIARIHAGLNRLSAPPKGGAELVADL